MSNGQHVKGSPFRSQAYDAKAIQVDDIPDGIVNQPVEFESKFLMRKKDKIKSPQSCKILL